MNSSSLDVIAAAVAATTTLFVIVFIVLPTGSRRTTGFDTVKMLLFQQYPFFHFLAIIPFATAQRVLPVGEIQSAALVELHEVIISPPEGLKKRGAVPQPRKYYPPKPQRDADSSPAMDLDAVAPTPAVVGYAAPPTELAQSPLIIAVALVELVPQIRRFFQSSKIPSLNGWKISKLQGAYWDFGPSRSPQYRLLFPFLISSAKADFQNLPKVNAADKAAATPEPNAVDTEAASPKATNAADQEAAVTKEHTAEYDSDYYDDYYDYDYTTTRRRTSSTRDTDTLLTTTRSSTSSTSFTFTPLSFTFPSITLPSFTLTNLPSYSYYTTTVTWYYYSFYIYTLGITRTPTSSRVTTITSFSIYASARSEADSIFASITADITFPRSVTAPGYSTGATATPSTDTGPSRSPGGAAAAAADGGSGSASAAAKKGNGGWEVWVFAIVGVLTGVGMLVL
ncbi:MAG: hypothetical protein Q9164_001480 [Protoblastenia rupestris]